MMKTETSPAWEKQFPFTKFYWADTCILTITVAKEESSSLKCENSGALSQWHLRRKHLLEVRCWFLSSFFFSLFISAASGPGWGMQVLCCPTAHGILVPPARAQPTSLREVRFLAIGPPGKSQDAGFLDGGMGIGRK